MRRQAGNSHEQDTKYVVIIACILVMVVLLPLGYVRYKTRYEAEQISTLTSPDGDYELVIYSVGEPDFPFGAAHGRLVLKGKEKTVAYRSFEVANDGARFYDGDLETTWYIDRVEVVVSGSEQSDELVTLRFDGQTSSRRLTARYRREDTDIEKDSEQDSAITEKASGDSREDVGNSADYAVDSATEDQPENKEITVGYQAIFEKYSDATAGKFEVYYGASESSSRCILSESDTTVEYIVYDGKSENGKCGLYVRYRTEKGGVCMTTVSTNSGKIINVVSREEESKTLTLSDQEMDARAVEAVKAAINKARVCKKPIAGYDKENKKAYIEYASGEIKYAK